MKTFKDTKYGDLTGKVYEGNINVSNIKLESLEGAPKEVHGYFDCNYNNLKNLKGAPKVVKRNFYCSNNKNLNSLEGAPKVVEGGFWCSNNENLTSLKGASKEVHGNFYCNGCPKLTSLDELLGTEINGELKSDIMSDEEFRKHQVLYKQAKGNMKKYKILNDNFRSMKKKPIVMVDVDETVVDNIEDWKTWYMEITSEELELKKFVSIDENLISDEHINPLNYWKNPNLYDEKKPIKEAVKVIKKFNDKFDFVFVSNCFSEHKDSKIKFIKKYFGKYPFVDTSHKEYVMCDIAIDDRKFYLRNIKEKQPNCKIIQMKTRYNNNNNKFYYFDWHEIEEFLENY